MSESPPSIARFMLRGGSIALLSRVVALPAGLAVQMLMARLIPPEHLGAYFLTQSLVIVLGNLSSLGIPQPLSRLLAQRVGRGDRGGSRAVLGSGLRIVVASVSGLALLYAGVGDWLAERLFESPVMASGTLVAAAWLAGSGLQGACTSAISGFHQVGLASWLLGPIISLFMLVTLGALMLWSGESDFHTIVLLSAAGTWVNLAVCGVILWSNVRGATPRPGGDTARTLLMSGFPVLGSALLNTPLLQADLWIVGALMPGEVALYGAAKRLIRLVGLPLVIVGQVVPPLVADLYAKGEFDRVQRGVRGAATLAGLPALLALGFIMIAAESILSLVFGDFYGSAGLLARILCLERIIFVLVGPASVLLMMTGHESVLFRIQLWSGLLWIAAITAGGAFAGAPGVAVGYTASSAIRETWILIEARRRTGIQAQFNPFHVASMVEALRRAARR